MAYNASANSLLSTTMRYTNPDMGPQTAVTKFEYGDAANPGLPTRVIPPRGNTGASPDYTYATTLTYGATGPEAGMLVGTSDPFGNTTTYEHDSVGRRTRVIDPLGNAAGGVPAEHTTEYVSDNEDRVRVVRTPAPQAGGSQLVTELRYDAVGNRTVQIDANGQVTTYGFDERDGLFQAWRARSRGRILPYRLAAKPGNPQERVEAATVLSYAIRSLVVHGQWARSREAHRGEARAAEAWLWQLLEREIELRLLGERLPAVGTAATAFAG